MSFITTCDYANAEVITVTVGNRKLFWLKMSDVEKGLCLKNMSDIVIKEIHGKYETKKTTKKQDKKYERTLRQISKNPKHNNKDI